MDKTPFQSSISAQLISTVSILGLSANTLRSNNKTDMLIKNIYSHPAEVICQFPLTNSPIQSSHAAVFLT
jgi:hypothetical protein